MRARRRAASIAAVLAFAGARLVQHRWPAAPAPAAVAIFRGVVRSLWVSRSRTAEQRIDAFCEGAWFEQELIGCDAASRRWFGASFEVLPPAEAALLLAVAGAPRRLDSRVHPERATRARAELLTWLRRLVGAAVSALPLVGPLLYLLSSGGGERPDAAGTGSYEVHERPRD